MRNVAAPQVPTPAQYVAIAAYGDTRVLILTQQPTDAAMLADIVRRHGCTPVNDGPAARALVENLQPSWERSPHRSDIGWSEFDVELYGNRWSHVQLTTVTEDHPNDRQLLRCRLRANWSLQARVVFWSLAAVDLRR